MGGFFIHSMLCLMPVIYQTIMKNGKFELGETVINRIYDIIKIPFYFPYIVLDFITTGIVVYSIVVRYLQVPTAFALLNPVVFLIAGALLRKLKYDWFYDLPGICMPSLGLGMFGLTGIVSLSG